MSHDTESFDAVAVSSISISQEVAVRVLRAGADKISVEHPPEAMGALIRDIFRAMIARVEYQFVDTDLVLSQWLALKLIGNGTIACIGDVTRELGIESGASTRLVDQLENRGLLTRQRSADDRRIVRIALTEGGAAVIEEMQPRLAQFWREQLNIFSPTDLDILFAMLLRLRNKLGNEKIVITE